MGRASTHSRGCDALSAFRLSVSTARPLDHEVTNHSMSAPPW